MREWLQNGCREIDDAQRTQEPIAHIVTKALAEYLQVPHHTLYQSQPPPFR